MERMEFNKHMNKQVEAQEQAHRNPLASHIDSRIQFLEKDGALADNEELINTMHDVSSALNSVAIFEELVEEGFDTAEELQKNLVNAKKLLKFRLKEFKAVSRDEYDVYLEYKKGLSSLN